MGAIGRSGCACIRALRGSAAGGAPCTHSRVAGGCDLGLEKVLSSLPSHFPKAKWRVAWRDVGIIARGACKSVVCFSSMSLLSSQNAATQSMHSRRFLDVSLLRLRLRLLHKLRLLRHQLTSSMHPRVPFAVLLALLLALLLAHSYPSASSSTSPS